MFKIGAVYKVKVIDPKVKYKGDNAMAYIKPELASMVPINPINGKKFEFEYMSGGNIFLVLELLFITSHTHRYKILYNEKIYKLDIESVSYEPFEILC